MHYVDIVALPRTHILKELAKYAEDPAERDKLLLMADTSAEGWFTILQKIDILRLVHRNFELNLVF